MDVTKAVHKFEEAGLGKAPFRFLYAEDRRGPIKVVDAKTGVEMEVGAPGQAMGTCDYCGNGIALCCVVRSADGREFVVGSDCVRKTGDAGIRRAVNLSTQQRRKEIEKARIAAMAIRIVNDATLRALLATQPHGQDWGNKKGLTALDRVEWLFAKGGNAGKLAACQMVARIEGAK